MVFFNQFRLWQQRLQRQLGRTTPERRQPLRRAGMEQLEDRRLMAGDIRTYDGTGNNLVHLEWGSTEEQFLRIVPAAYADGLSAPTGADRPSARTISNTLNDHVEGDVKNDRNLSAMVYAWGQFIDHDIDLTNTAAPKEAFNISVPTGDAEFDPTGTGTKTIALSRSEYDTTTGTTNARQQVNSITSFMDASMVYGSDAETAASLRTFSGGLLKVSGENLLPVDATSGMFLAGDIRANENIELTSLQTLFMREHNRVASDLAKKNPSWTDEQLYQGARRVVIAEVQAITYNEFLPTLLGNAAPKEYRGYDPKVNPGISNEFATAAFRVGHTMLGDDVEFLNNAEEETREAVALKDAFFNPSIVKETGIDPILKYLATDRAEEIDLQLVDSVRNFLFGALGSGGLDLASLNIQRGREHGLDDYNATRVKYGLSAVKSFADITKDTAVQAKLQELYGSVDNIDLWIGGLAEDHLPDTSVGPTFAKIISEQFDRLRAGDRFWYQKDFSGAELKKLEQTTLAQVIRNNTSVTNLQQEVFRYGSEISGRVIRDLNRDGKAQSNEPAQTGQVVKLLDSTNQVVATTMTKRDGSYSFYGVENGTYKVQEMLPAGATRSAVTSGMVIIDKRMAAENVTLAIPVTSAPGAPTKSPAPPTNGGPQQPPPSGPRNGPVVPSTGPQQPVAPPGPSGTQIGMGQPTAPTTGSKPVAAPATTARPTAPATSRPLTPAPTTNVVAPVATPPAPATKPGTPPVLGMHLPGAKLTGRGVS